MGPRVGRPKSYASLLVLDYDRRRYMMCAVQLAKAEGKKLGVSSKTLRHKQNSFKQALNEIDKLVRDHAVISFTSASCQLLDTYPV